jgi:hypothetical protein
VLSWIPPDGFGDTSPHWTLQEGCLGVYRPLIFVTGVPWFCLFQIAHMGLAFYFTAVCKSPRQKCKVFYKIPSLNSDTCRGFFLDLSSFR